MFLIVLFVYTVSAAVLPPMCVD